IPAPASVARPGSARSTSSVRAPARPSSNAVAVPTMPPPTMTTSNELKSPSTATRLVFHPFAHRPTHASTPRHRFQVRIRTDPEPRASGDLPTGISRGRGEMNEDPGEATDPIVDAVVRASRALVGITVRALASVSDEVTLPQLRTLVVVSLQGPQTVSALAERLDVHASTMTRMCNRLVTRGLVARTPSALDRREVVIELTPPGQGLVDAVMAH